MIVESGTVSVIKDESRCGCQRKVEVNTFHIDLELQGAENTFWSGTTLTSGGERI